MVSALLRALLLVIRVVAKGLLMVVRFGIRSAANRALLERAGSLAVQAASYAAGRDLHTAAVAAVAGFLFRSLTPDIIEWAISIIR